MVSLAQAPAHRMIRSNRPSERILTIEILEDVPVSRSDETFDRAKYVPSRSKIPTDGCVKTNPNTSNSIGYLFKNIIIELRSVSKEFEVTLATNEAILILNLKLDTKENSNYLFFKD